MTSVRKAEGTELSLLMFFYFFLITFSVYIIKPVKDALFMHQLGSRGLPYAFLLTAVLMALAVALNSRFLQKVKRSFYLTSTLGFFIAGGLIFWFLLTRPSPWKGIFYLLWSWGDIFLVTSVTQFWILVNDLFSPRLAKKRVGFLVSGGLLGGIGGSLVARFLARPLGTENLVLACPAILAFCVLIILVLTRRFPQESRIEVEFKLDQKRQDTGFGGSLSALKKSRYLLLLSGMMITAIVVSNLVDFQYKTVARDVYTQKNDLTSFFGSFNLGMLILSYFLAVLLTSRILKHFGFRVALLILPIMLLLGSLALFPLALAGASLLPWAIFIKGADKSLSHSLTQSVRELLYIPVPPEVKYKAKVFIDMFLNKFADGLTGLLLIVLSSFIKLTLPEISGLAVICIALWFSLVLRVTKEYVGIVKKNLQIKWPDADRLVTEKIDIDMTKLVFDTLQSRERSSVLYAMNLLDLIKKEKLSPELRNLISNKSAEIRARSMDALMDVEGEVLVPDLDDTIAPEDLDAQVKEIMSLDVYQQLMKEQIERAAKEKGVEAEIARMEAAKAMGMMEPNAPLTRNLKKLLRDESPEVVRYAAESAGRLKRREWVPLLVGHLSRPATQEAAAQALTAYGNTIIGTLRDYLSDPDENIRARKAIPAILARTGSPRAAELLLLELEKENTDLEKELIEALHKMRFSSPRIRFSERPVLVKTVALIKKCYLLIIQIYEMKADKKKEVLARDLENNLARTLKHIFDLLGLIYPQEDIIKAYQNISAGTKKALDYSIELLDNILKKEVKDILLPLIEDTSFEEKVRMSRRMLKSIERIDVS